MCDQLGMHEELYWMCESARQEEETKRVCVVSFEWCGTSTSTNHKLAKMRMCKGNLCSLLTFIIHLCQVRSHWVVREVLGKFKTRFGLLVHTVFGSLHGLNFRQ